MPLSEFEIVRLFAVEPPRGAGVRVGIGDDCAVLELDAERCLLVTKDLLVEGVHFLRGTLTPWQLGYKSMAVNLSDVAAMGGTPRAAFLGLALPPGPDLDFVVGFRDGLMACAQAFGVDLLGGDTTGSLRDVMISLTLLGEAPRAEVVLRAGAQAGDHIVLGGPVGDSAAGLWLLTEGAARAAELPADQREALLRAHLEPRPQVALGRWLAGRGVATAMIDVSDGLLQDLGHLCAAARLGARIEDGALPVSGAQAAARALHGGDPLGWALAGGEDYVLLFTVPSQRLGEVVAGARGDLGIALHPIGRMEPEPGLRLVRGGEVGAVAPAGWDHFRG
ncbi:MAG: thiamine-phosphate kinase [Pseudomonadota bacterium]